MNMHATLQESNLTLYAEGFGQVIVNYVVSLYVSLQLLLLMFLCAKTER